jgi:hypothetical protein
MRRGCLVPDKAESDTFSDLGVQANFTAFGFHNFLDDRQANTITFDAIAWL